MKNLVLYFSFLFSISSFIFATTSVDFTTPADNATYTIPAGSIAMDITVNFTYQYDYYSYYFKLTTEQGRETITNGHVVHNVTAGSKHWTLEIYTTDGQNNSYAKDVIDFSVVYGPRGITVDNNFTDNSGNGTHGSIIIDGSSHAIPSTGYYFTKNVGQNLTLSKRLSPQIDNQGYQRALGRLPAELLD